MKPPIFLWKSGTLDAFDTVEELANLYPPATLGKDDFIACDCEGRILLAGRESDGLAVFAVDEQQPPSPDTLRNILRGYLERGGTSAEELNSLSLAELVAKAYPPPDPRLAEMKFKVQLYVAVMAIFGVGLAIYGLVTCLSR